MSKKEQSGQKRKLEFILGNCKGHRLQFNSLETLPGWDRKGLLRETVGSSFQS